MQYVGMSKAFYGLIHIDTWATMVGMHIHIIPNRNSTPAVLLRESYRVGGNVRKRTLANLSKLPMDAVDAIRRISKGKSSSRLKSPSKSSRTAPCTMATSTRCSAP